MMSDADCAMSLAMEAAQLLRCATVSGKAADEAEFVKLRDCLEELFPLVHSRCEVHLLGGSLLYRWPGIRSDRACLLMSHHDVVAADGQWIYPPFSGTVASGKLWGRGALDVKANLYCILKAVEDLIKSGITPAFDVYIASSNAEEVGGNKLVADYLQMKGVNLIWLLDEGSAIQQSVDHAFSEPFAMVALAEKGIVNVKCVAKGRGGHSSSPGKGTPLPRLAAFICEVEKTDLFPLHLDQLSRELFRRLAAWSAGAAAERFSRIAGKEIGWQLLLTDKQREMLGTTLAFTMAGGSLAPNVLPSEAFVVCNIRTAPGYSTDAVLTVLTDIAAKHDIALELLSAVEPSDVTDPASPAFKQLEMAVGEVWPQLKVLPCLLPGGTDTKHFTHICSACLRFTPMQVSAEQRAAIHGIDEHIDIEVLPAAVEFFKKMILTCT